MRRGFLVVPLLVAVALFAAAASVLAAESGPFTIRGVVLGVDGKPIAGWPLRVSPKRPNGDDDVMNVFYRVPNYNDHLTYTNAEGQFVMTDVIDYPQVTTRQYRIWSGGSDLDVIRMQRNPCIQVSTGVDFATATSNEIYLVIKAEARSALRVTMSFDDGTPFNGTVSVAIRNGKLLQTRTAVFRDGYWGAPAIPLGTGVDNGRILILKVKSIQEATAKLLAEGKELTADSVTELGVLLDKRVQFLPLQVSSVELVLPASAKGSFAE